eukprot:TRINITY_DN17290_c0_g1_i1.p1 TRINITY_DN17290_c0_g1~~TRINITY_DN17290_c0_g1_i1.p1  ORF type:complete len:961 (+),score=172.07 TRINITY_DN17290_c0_g1_i1:138-2885(+)
MAESEVLNNCPQFQLNCDIGDLGELGAGWVLFFHFVRSLGLLCVILFAVQLPAFFHYTSMDKSYIDKWSDVPKYPKNHSINFWYVTVGNTGPDREGLKTGTDSVWPWLCALLCALVMLNLLAQYSRYQARTKLDVDATEVDPNDYALFIEGLPEDATDEAEIKEFLEEYARIGEHTSVVQVVIGYDVEMFQSDMREIVEVKKKIAETTSAADKATLSESLKALVEPLKSIDALRNHLPCTGFAIAVLRSQEEHRQVLQEWDTWNEFFAYELSCLQGLGLFKSRTEEFRGDHVLRITRARNPSDILWENMGVTPEERFKAKCKTYAMTVFIFLVCLVAVVGMQKISAAAGNPRWMSILPTLVVLTVRIWASMSLKKYVIAIRHPTKTERDLSLLVKLTLFYVLSYCVIAIILNNNPDDGDWYTTGGLFTDITSLMVMNCFSIPASIFCGCAQGLRNKIRDAKCDLDNPPPGLRQKKYQSLFELPEMDQPRAFAKVLITFLTGLLFLPMVPYAALIAAAGLFCEYWAFKYQLLRQSKRPYRQGHEVSFGALKIMYFGVALFALTQALFLKPSLKGGAKTWSGSLTLPLIVISSVMTFAPHWFNALICGAKFFQAEDRSETHTDVDYYTAQKAWPKHQKYHTTNLVYLHGIEMLAIKRKKPLWDPRTGNLRDPRVKPSAADTSLEAGTSAPRPGGLTGAADSEPGVESTDSVDPAVAAGGDRVEGVDDDVEGPEESGAIGEEDPAALAMEEMKVKVPLSMLGEEDDDGASTIGDSSEDESGSDADVEVGMPAASMGHGIKPGVTCRIDGLESEKASRFNGTTCTVKSAEAGGKWMVELEDGQKARLPASCLHLLLSETLKPGMKAKIVNLSLDKAKQYNGSTATILEWNAKVGKWNVQLFTGIKATIPASNLQALTPG